MIHEKVNINRYFMQYMWKHKFLFAFYILLLFVYPIHRIVVPKYYGKVITNLNKNNKTFMSNIKTLLFFFIVYNIFIALLYKIQGILVPRFSEFSVQKILRNLLNNKTLDYDNLQVGEILAKIIKVPNILYHYLDSLRSLIFSQVFITLGTIYYYSSVSKKVMFSFIGLMIGLLLLQILTYHSTLNIELKQEKEKDSIYQHFQDLLNNLISVIVCKQEDYETNYLKKKFAPFIVIFEKSLNINFIFRIIFALYSVVSFVLLNLMLYKELKSKLISNEVFISSFIVTWSILSIFTEANYSIRSIVDMYSQIKDMEYYFNEKAETELINSQQKSKKSFQNGNIRFENIYYEYKDNNKNKNYYALKNINLEIKQYENTALIGQIGSGKSTLVKLLLKLYEPSSGNIYIGNTNLKDIKYEDLYEHVFYIPQKPKLMDRSLYENIFYGMDLENKDKNIKQLNTIMKQMNMDESIIQVFMEKMDQNMGNDGVKISGGQRQLVWIIRAMLRNPSIIIFDEPTSALDKENKDKIVSTIKSLGKEKTIIIISHDQIDSGFRKIAMKQGVVDYEQKDFYGWES